MGYIRGEAREQTTMFPVTLDELIPADHLCRVIEAFAARLNLGRLGFVRAEPAETGRPGYDPRDLLKLYLYGYLQQIRSSRRLEAECCRNVEVTWLLQRVTPDHKRLPSSGGCIARQCGGCYFEKAALPFNDMGFRY